MMAHLCRQLGRTPCVSFKCLRRGLKWCKILWMRYRLSRDTEEDPKDGPTECAATELRRMQIGIAPIRMVGLGGTSALSDIVELNTPPYHIKSYHCMRARQSFGKNSTG